MTKDELLKKLRELQGDQDQEGAHWDADQALISFIGDPEIVDAFEKIGKWYA